MKLNFNDIDNFDDVWKWIEGPFRSAVTGMRMISEYNRQQYIILGTRGKKGSTILRHNIIIGRPRLHQIRSETSGCVKPSKYDVFPADCISMFDSSKNQEKGIRTTAECIASGKEEYECKVGLDDNGQVMYTR